MTPERKIVVIAGPRRAAVRARNGNSALLAHDFPFAVAKCVAATQRSLRRRMMKRDPKLMRYASPHESVKVATRTQYGAFRLSYAAAVATTFLFSSLAPAALIALIWRETSLSLMVFKLTFVIALIHAIGAGLPVFLICQLRGWINLVSCVVLGAFIGILPAGILAYPAQLSDFIVGAWTGALTDPNGVITAAIWDGYIKPLIYCGLLGAWGGFVFWVIWKYWNMVDGGRP